MNFYFLDAGGAGLYFLVIGLFYPFYGGGYIIGSWYYDMDEI